MENLDKLLDEEAIILFQNEEEMKKKLEELRRTTKNASRYSYSSAKT